MKFNLTPYNLQELGQRKNQEDSLFPGLGMQTTDDRLFVLCDGMGGHEKGEVASATVCETISSTILSRWNPNEPLSDNLLQQAISDAYDALDAKDNGEEKKMGTTLTLVCFHAGGVTVAHVGDSRVYQIRPDAYERWKDDNTVWLTEIQYGVGGIVFKTQDHSLVNDLIRIGEITEEEAKSHPQKNVITRAMLPCQEHRAKADIAHLTDIQDGDYFFMCSDGMLEETSDENLMYIFSTKKTNEEKLEMLRSVTEDNKDNHTAHLIYINKVEHSKVQADYVIKQEKECISSIETSATSQEQVAQPATEKTHHRSFLLYIIAILSVALLACLAWLFLTIDKKDTITEGGQVEVSELLDSIESSHVKSSKVDSKNSVALKDITEKDTTKIGKETLSESTEAIPEQNNEETAVTENAAQSKVDMFLNMLKNLANKRNTQTDK